MKTSDELISDIIAIKEDNPGWGRGRISQALNISSSRTQRLLDKIKEKESSTAELQKLLDNFSRSEVKAILQGAQTSKGSTNINFDGEHFRFGVISDTHIGHEKFNEAGWNASAEVFEREGIERVFHCGDVLEGMSGRPGHIYELSEIGFDNQFNKACELIENYPCQIDAIDGNHDLWYKQKADMGISVGRKLERELPNYKYLGDHEADIYLGNIHVKLWHGGDGASYAASYRGQKIIESFSGGEKPHLLLTGHDHKALFQDYRNVQHIGAGTVCGQSGWMRGKRLSAHEGFWVVDVWQDDTGLARIRPEWYKLYR